MEISTTRFVKFDVIAVHKGLARIRRYYRGMERSVKFVGKPSKDK